MGTRYRATKLRTTLQASLGTKVPEKREQLAFLADRIEIKGLPCPPIAGVEGHPIYKQAKAYPYEDISAYFRMVDEEVRQRGERAKAPDSITLVTKTIQLNEPQPFKPCVNFHTIDGLHRRCTRCGEYFPELRKCCARPVAVDCGHDDDTY